MDWRIKSDSYKMASLKEYRSEQLDKLKKLKSLGINPYPSQTQRDVSLDEINQNFDRFDGRQLFLAGRLLSLREHGQITFLDLADEKGQLQLIVRQEALKEASHSNNQLKYEDLNLLTRGDFINVYGQVQKSQRGENSLLVSQLTILAKVLRPLPLKLTDLETRRKKRYLDLALNVETRERFRQRSAFWQAARVFLNKNGFSEINIPVLEHSTGGAEAQPFKTHMKALDQDFYLRISHELPLKKLLGGGYEKIYDIGPRFRNEHYTEEHLPEHVALEWYWAYASWQDGMKLMEAMFAFLAEETFKRKSFDHHLGKIDFSKQPWPQVEYCTLMQEHYKINVLEAELKQVNALLKKHKLEVENENSLISGIDKLFKNIRKDILGPIWVIRPPIAMSPLSKPDRKDDRLAERFWGLIGGSELCNGYGELNDPLNQLEQMKVQQTRRDSGDEEAHMLDLDFIEMLEYGMPPACGLGFSERVFWSLAGVPAKDGVPFNHFKSENDSTMIEIYPELFS